MLNSTGMHGSKTVLLGDLQEAVGNLVIRCDNPFDLFAVQLFGRDVGSQRSDFLGASLGLFCYKLLVAMRWSQIRLALRGWLRCPAKRFHQWARLLWLRCLAIYRLIVTSGLRKRCRLWRWRWCSR